MKIIHLSDLHFGTEKPGIVDVLIADIKKHTPDMIIVSGDLTQRAKHWQYQAAKEFLNKFFGTKMLCVPGNHDISLYNLLERFVYPFNKFKKWISPVCSSYVDDSVAILGINSVTPYKPMSGFVTDEQLNFVKEFFSAQPEKILKIVVMHHNLIKSERHKIINDAEKLINVFAQLKVKLVLSGHIHFPAVELLKRDSISNNMYVVTAGTAISTRTTAPNSYNLIEIHQNKFVLSVRAFKAQQFFEESKLEYDF